MEKRVRDLVEDEGTYFFDGESKAVSLGIAMASRA